MGTMVTAARRIQTSVRVRMSAASLALRALIRGGGDEAEDDACGCGEDDDVHDGVVECAGGVDQWFEAGEVHRKCWDYG